MQLWYLRLASLSRLRLFNQTSAECTNLFVVLNAIEPPSARAWVYERILPFELEVMQARLKYWAGDHMGHLDALNVLLNKCRTNARKGKSNPTTVSMWKERGARVCLIIASQFVEMKVRSNSVSPSLLDRLIKTNCRISELRRDCSSRSVDRATRRRLQLSALLSAVYTFKAARSEQPRNNSRWSPQTRALVKR